VKRGQVVDCTTIDTYLVLGVLEGHVEELIVTLLQRLVQVDSPHVAILGGSGDLRDNKVTRNNFQLETEGTWKMEVVLYNQVALRAVSRTIPNVTPSPGRSSSSCTSWPLRRDMICRRSPNKIRKWNSDTAIDSGLCNKRLLFASTLLSCSPLPLAEPNLA
jgi:hypothetical protein